MLLLSCKTICLVNNVNGNLDETSGVFVPVMRAEHQSLILWKNNENVSLGITTVTSILGRENILDLLEWCDTCASHRFILTAKSPVDYGKPKTSAAVIVE
jgi:hypothetical protein